MGTARLPAHTNPLEVHGNLFASVEERPGLFVLAVGLVGLVERETAFGLGRRLVVDLGGLEILIFPFHRVVEITRFRIGGGQRVDDLGVFPLR